MASNELRYYQQEGLDAMRNMPDGQIGCVYMACGTGKTLIIKTFITEFGPGLTIIVFPRLALIEQYIRCYKTNDVQYIIVGSIEGGFSATRNKNKIRTLINEGHSIGKHVVILTTYISIVNLVNVLDGYEVDNIIYDESHHTNTDIQDITFSKINPNRTYYFTATPVSNHLNIIYKYSYEQALVDNVSRKFIVSIYVTAQPKSPEAIYEMLGYFARKYDIRNTICYHQFSNVPGKETEGSSVNDHLEYVGIDNAIALNLDGTPLLDNNGNYQLLLPPGSEIFCFQGKTPISERVRILEHIKSGDQYSVVHTCETVSEGVDTQEIDSVCIIDEVKDVVKTTQILGRAMRKSRERPEMPSYILIPFFNCEGRGQEGQNIQKLQVNIDTSLKGRSKAKSSSVTSKLTEEFPRHYYTPNQTNEVDLERITTNESVNLISSIMSFAARDKGDNGGLADFEIEEIHKRTDNFTIETMGEDGTNTTTTNVSGRVQIAGPTVQQPQIEFYGTNLPLDQDKTPLEMMIQIAKDATAEHINNLETLETRDKNIRTPPDTETAGYYFIDFIASVIRTNDPRYKRYPEVEVILEETLGQNWEYGIYTTQRVDERIMDIINNKRFGFPKLIPDPFNMKWKNERNKLGTDVAFLAAWKARSKK